MNHRFAYARPYDWIARPRLLSRIGSIHEHTLARLTLVVAPVGYGKSVLALQWADSLRDSAIVLYYAFGATNRGSDADSTLDGRIRSILEAYRTEGSPDPGDVRNLLHEIEALSAPVVIVLDNADALGEAVLSTLLDDFLLSATRPPFLYVMVLGRREIRLPAQLLATPGMVMRIGRVHLAYTIEDLEAYVTRAESVSIGADEYAGILERTGGWPFGIWFVVNLLQASYSTGRSDAFDEYLSMTVLDALPSATRDLLLAAGATPVVTDDLWETLADGAPEGILPLGHVLEIVPSLRVPPITSNPVMFCIVPLVRESLARLARQRLATSEIDRVADGVMRWLLAHERFPSLAAYAREAGCWQRLFDLIDPICREYAIRDNHSALVALLAPIPAETIVTREEFAFWYLVSLLPFGRVDLADPLVSWYLDRWGEQDDPLGAGRAWLVRGLHQTATGSLNSAFEFLTKALECLPADAHHERMRAATSLLFALSRTGMRDRELEVERIARMERSHLPRDQYWWIFFVQPAVANRSALRGNLRDAVDLLTFHLQSNDLNDADSREVYLLRLALIDLERNDIQQAEARLAQIGSFSAGVDRQSVRLYVQAMIHHAYGDDAPAFTLLHDAIRTINQHSGSGLLAPRFSALLAQFWIDSERYDLADEWASDATFVPGSWPLWFGEVVPGAVLAHLHIVRERWGEALGLVNALIAEGEYLGYLGPLIHIYALKGLVLSLMGARIESQVALRTAIQMSEGQGFHRSFFVGSFDTRDLLNHQGKAMSLPLLLGSVPTGGIALTGREVEIMRLAQEGLTNGEIAERLYISVYTVKNHLTRIYQRLSVNSRQDALQAARALHIL